MRIRFSDLSFVTLQECPFMKEQKPEILQVDVEKIIRSQENKVVRNLPGFLVRFIKWLVKEDELNEALQQIGHLKGFAFIEAASDLLGLKYKVIGAENIPDHGHLIFVGNHALGGADFFALMHVLKERFPKVHHLTNEVLMVFDPLKDFFLPVNVFGKNPKEYREIYKEKLRDKDVPMTIFPSGEVARMHNGKWDDGLWRSGFVRFAKEYGRTVVPFYIPDRNSKLFYNIHKWRKRLGIKANLELFLLPRELYKKQGKELTIVFGEPLPAEYFDDSKTVHEWADEVKKKVYALQEKIEAKE